MKSGVKFVVKISGRLRASFPEEGGAAKFHQKFHGIFHGNFHAQFQEKFSRQHFCTPCRTRNFGAPVWVFPSKKSAEGKRAYRAPPCKNCKRPALKQPALGTPKPLIGHLRLQLTIVISIVFFGGLFSRCFRHYGTGIARLSLP